MAVEPPTELLRRWKAEELTVEMAIGQLLQHVSQLQTDISSLQHVVTALRGELSRSEGETPLSLRKRGAR